MKYIAVVIIHTGRYAQVHTTIREMIQLHVVQKYTSKFGLTFRSARQLFSSGPNFFCFLPSVKAVRYNVTSQLVSHAGRRRLRSADIDTCCVPRTNTRLGERSFAAAGPRLWNSLPARIRQPDNDIGEFRRQLKSFLFKWHRGA